MAGKVVFSKKLNTRRNKLTNLVIGDTFSMEELNFFGLIKGDAEQDWGTDISLSNIRVYENPNSGEMFVLYKIDERHYIIFDRKCINLPEYNNSGGKYHEWEESGGEIKWK